MATTAAASLAANRSGNSSSFSSPLPPCPEDPPAPPPPSCTPPKYQPLEENDNTEDEERGDLDSVGDTALDQQGDGFPTPPPPLSPPSASPLLMLGSPPPPPPPPPYSPPSVKIDLNSIGFPGQINNNSSGSPGSQRSAEYDDNDTEQESRLLDAGDDEYNNDSADNMDSQREMSDDAKESSSADQDGAGNVSSDSNCKRSSDKTSPTNSLRSPRGGVNAAAIRSSSSSVIASMRSAASEREIMAVDFVREVPVERPRWYVGDIESYSIIDKVGSGTYGYAWARLRCAIVTEPG